MAAAPTLSRSRTEEELPADDQPVMPPAAVLRRLKISPEVGWYLVSRGIPLPETPPMTKTPEPRWVKGAVFDPERVDKVLAALSLLRHTQGRLAGQPLNPDPWQIAYILGPVFGWVHKNEHGDYVRIIRTLYVDVPRKNGKTTLSGGIALYLTAADGEEGAQVVAAASTKDQAGLTFAPIKVLAEKAPALRGLVKPLGTRIIHPRSNSYFAVVASSGDAQHGANLHGAIIDELHVHKTPDLVEALETGTGSRAQPLITMITTADAGKPNTIYARKRKYIDQLAKGIFKDQATYGVVFAVPNDTRNLFAEATIRRANPGYPISPTREALEGAAKKAQNSPAELASYKRLHLGIRTRQTTAYIDLPAWKRNAGKPIDEEEELAGRACYGGLDLGSVSDLTALAWAFPRTDAGGYPVEGYDVIWRFWTPEDNLEALDKRTANSASKLWVPQGWLKTTPGNVTDYGFIKEQILEDADRFDVLSIGFDRWGATHLTNELLDEDLPMVKTGQGYQTMNPAMKEIQRLVLKGSKQPKDPLLRHGGNPVMVWMIDNLAVATDPAGNVKPDKANSGDKIDGVSALANAVSESINTDQQDKRTENDLTVA